jgi:glycosyltransferase involved in cell wall biosynthesis
MKLLITNGIFPPDIGGPATFVPLLAREARERYNEVTVITLGMESGQYQNGPYKVISISRALPKIVRILKTVQIISSEAKTAHAIFSNGLYLETSAVLRLRKRKSVAKIVGDPIWEKARNQGRTKLNLEKFQISEWSFSDKFTNWLFRQSWKSFDRLTCPSLALVEMVRERIDGKDVSYIPNGVDLPLIGEKQNPIRLITVSRLVSWKNIEHVIEAAATLSIRLTIVGDGPEKTSLELHAQQLNAQVHFTGNLSPEEVKKHLKKSKYFLQMSDYEGLSFSLLEAMSLGLVPIVSGNEGNRQVVEHEVNGMITAIDGLSIVQAIQEIEQSGTMYEQLSKEAIERVKSEFNGKVNRVRILDLLEISKR